MFRKPFWYRHEPEDRGGSAARKMGFLVLTVAGLKWLLLSVVLVLGVGKAIARVASWVVNNACQGGC